MCFIVNHIFWTWFWFFFNSYFWFIFQIWCLPEMPEIQRWRTDLTGNVSDFDNGKRSLGLISTKTLISINLWDVVRKRSDVILKISYYHSLFWSGDMTFFNQSLIVRLTNVNTSYLLNRHLLSIIFLKFYLYWPSLVFMNIWGTTHSWICILSQISTLVVYLVRIWAGANLSYQRKIYVFSTC